MDILVNYTLHGERNAVHVSTDAEKFIDAVREAAQTVKNRFADARNMHFFAA